MTKLLAVVGASGHGKVVADAAIARGWRKVAFYDDAWPELAQVGRWPVEGCTAEMRDHLGRFDSVMVGIGDNRTRLAKLAELETAGAAIGTILHPQSAVSRFAEIGVGGVVFAGAVVNVDARLGRGVIINTGATVDHDCVLADGVHISPGANLAGDVIVGEASWIGIGAAIKQGVTIGRNVMVAAGAIVIRDVPDGTTVMGVPARISTE
tara:strand:+ start:3670 stop:4296 length:627 start_codon:yes stop_codon:yes gene_type:complete